MLNKEIAVCCRVEIDQETDEVQIVFRITDQQFKTSVKRDWLQDVELRLIGKSLVKDD